MFHIELRQFPHNHTRFNLTEAQLRELLLPWARGEVLELDERKWSPAQAQLTIIEGPRLELSRLSMGRGWRAAQREGRDVSERLLGEARAAVAAEGGAGAPPAPAPGSAPDTLALGVALGSLLGADAPRLLAAWREVAREHPALAPSESLALAERRAASGGG